MGAFVGWKPKRKRTASSDEEEVISEAHLKGLIAQFAGGMPPMPPPPE